MTRITKNICLGMVCFSALVISGCVQTSMMYRGQQASPEHVVALQKGGPIAGTWETFDIIIQYEYIQEGAVLEIKGQTALGDSYQSIYTRLNFLDTYLLFLDQDARVLLTADLVSSFNYAIDNYFRFSKPFSRSFRLPSGTASFTFGYRGEVCEGRPRQCIFFHQFPWH
jgi:hypothetical protein